MDWNVFSPPAIGLLAYNLSEIKEDDTMRKRIILGLLALVIGTAVLTVPGRASVGSMMGAEGETIILRSPFNSVVFNPCTGESVEISGESQTIVHTTQDENGGTHFNVHLLTIGHGMGLTSGTRYTINESSNYHINQQGCALDESLTEHVLVNSQGAADNFYIKFVLHLTIDANCQVRSTVDNATFFDCRG